MIVSAVADPTAFGPAGITDELSKREAIAFLKGIVSNGVLLDEPTQELIRSAIAEVTKLPTSMGQKIQLLLTEIKTQHKKFVVACDKTSWLQKKATSIPEKCAAVATILQADVVVTQPDHVADIQKLAGSSPEVCLLTDTSESNYETLRIRVLQLEKPVDELSLAEVEEFLGRAFKYSSTLRFFDYLMISSNHTRYFLAGIQFIATIWRKYCIVGDASSRTIELYTVANRQGAPKGLVTAAEANTRMETSIQVPLSNAIQANVARFIKEDVDPRIFHARGFETRFRAFTIDPGFDAIGPSGAIRRCLLKADKAAEVHFADCRKLKDVS